MVTTYKANSQFGTFSFYNYETYQTRGVSEVP